MTTNFPSSLDSITTTMAAGISAGDARTTAINASAPNATHHQQHNNHSDAIVAIETKVGVDSSSVTTTLDYLLKNTASVDPGHKHSDASINSVFESTIVSDSAKYFLLAGRSGGQTAYGGTAASETLVLSSTANATKGKIFIGSISMAIDEVNTRLGIGTTSPAASLQIASGNQSITGTTTATNALFINSTQTGTTDFSATVSVTPTLTIGASVSTLYGFNLQPVFNPAVGLTFTTVNGMQMGFTTSSGAGAITNGNGIYIYAQYGSIKPTTVRGAYITDIGSASITDAICIDLIKPTSATNKYYFGFDTADATAAGAYFGRIAVKYAGALKYIHIFSA